MNFYEPNLTPNQIFARLCEINKVTPKDLAEKFNIDIEVVAVFESVESIEQLKGNVLEKIKRIFHTENMPISKSDYKIFLTSLFTLRNLIKKGNKKEVARLKERLAPILKYPFYPEFTMLYRLFLINEMIVDGKIEEAEKALEESRPLCGFISNVICGYYRFRNEALILFAHGEYEEASNTFEAAINWIKLNKKFNENAKIPMHFEQENKDLYYNIALCATILSRPAKAIVNLQSHLPEHTNDMLDDFDVDIHLLYAVNYIRVNEVFRAQLILDKCFLKTKAEDNRTLLAGTLRNFGYSHRVIKDYDKAADYYKQALHTFISSTDSLMCMCEYTLCLIQMKNFEEARYSIKRGKELSTEEKEMHSIYFEALKCLIDILTNNNAEEAYKYIEDVAFPCFRHNSDKFTLIDYCVILEEHFTEVEDNLRIMEAVIRLRDLYNEINGGTIE